MHRLTKAEIDSVFLRCLWPIASALAVTCVWSCAPSQPPSQRSSIDVEAFQSALFDSIKLQRIEGCWTSAPSYTLSIDRSGRVLYTGWFNVASVGVETARLAPEKFIELLKAVEADFGEYARVDPGPFLLSDIGPPLAFITLSYDGVVFAQLKSSGLADRLDEICQTQAWVGPSSIDQAGVAEF